MDSSNSKDEIIEAWSDIGSSRKRNEDSILYMEVKLLLEGGKKTNLILMLVCDGVGGLNAGNWASSYCCSCIERIIREKNYKTVNDLIKKIESNMFIINNEILEKNKENSERLGHSIKSSTTFTLLIMHDGIGHLRHLGDSRLYEIIPPYYSDDGSGKIEGKVLNVLSEDQSDLMRKVRKHEMTLDELNASNDKRLLYMCMGYFSASKLDIFPSDFQLHPKASYLICTDGFWHNAKPKDLYRLAVKDLSLGDLITRMKTTDGETDNISAIIYRPKL